jgi:hypothetical protein
MCRDTFHLKHVGIDAVLRIPLLVTPTQKALFIKKAKASKLTLNEFVRRAAEAYNPSDDDEALIRLVAQVKQTRNRRPGRTRLGGSQTN